MAGFDWETKFATYGAYHCNPVNILIHRICVWPGFFHFTPSILDASISIPQLGRFYLAFNLRFFITLAHALLYVILDKKAGTFAVLLCFAWWLGASFAASTLGFSLPWKLFALTGQFIGHSVFEKRAPDVADNFAVAFITAPFFVLLELLHKLIGYEPYPGFYQSVKAKSEAEIKAWPDRKQK